VSGVFGATFAKCLWLLVSSVTDIAKWLVLLWLLSGQKKSISSCLLSSDFYCKTDRRNTQEKDCDRQIMSKENIF